MIEQGLYVGTVMHRRLRPKPHRFAYRAFWLALDLDRLESTADRLKLFSLGRFNLFGFDVRDHADGRSGPLRPKVEALVAKAGFDAAGAMTLLAMPRVLGHVFNPLSVYLCRDRAGRPSAIVWEVSNTFGERHSYVIGVAAGETHAIRQSCPKLLHVSPFIDMDVRYTFRIVAAADRLTIGIADHDGAGVLLAAALTAERRDLTDAALWSLFVRMPFMTLKTVAAIHWEALRLWLKSARFRRTPAGHVKPVDAYSSSAHGVGADRAA